MKANSDIREVNNSKENNNKDKALNRSRENSLKKDKNEKKCHEVCFKYSNEGYKNKSILSEVEISYYPQNDNLTLFEKKIEPKNYYNQGKQIIIFQLKMFYFMMIQMKKLKKNILKQRLIF